MGVVAGKSMMVTASSGGQGQFQATEEKQGKQVSGEGESQRGPYDLLMLWKIHSPEKQSSLCEPKTIHKTLLSRLGH